MSGPNVNTTGWASYAARPRSQAEPMLNFWAYKLLGDGGMETSGGSLDRFGAHQPQKLGRWLSGNKGRWTDGMSLVEDGQVARATRWRVRVR